MKKWVLITLLIVILLCAGWVLDLLWSAGQFRDIDSHFSGTCHPVTGAVGAEDITIHPITGIAYISSCDRRAVAKGKPGNGGIFAYDLNMDGSKPINLTPDADPDFQPLGISLYVDKGGRDALLVVNHQGGKNAVEIFLLMEGRLVHQRTVTDPALVSPNNILAVGPEQFYVTNDHRHTGGFMRFVEDYGRQAWSSVLFYTGSGFFEAATGLGYANGINISSDGRLLYVSTTVEQVLYIYDRNPSTHEISLKETIALHTGLDNVELDVAGRLYIAAHPKLLTYVKHAKDAAYLSPSQVLRLQARSGSGYRVDEIYLDSGAEISGASVAAVSGSRMLIGSVFDPKFLDCQLD
jgi:arylesterase/paraoxonase